MRDILVTAIVCGSIPFILARPYIGILVWSWLGYMNPHRLTFGFAYDFPFAFCVAIATLLAVVISKEPKRIPITGLTTVWLVFLVWMSITTVFALYPAPAWDAFQTVLKIQLMTFVTIVVMRSRERLRMLIWVIVLSLGYFGVKGGVFTIINGGDFRVWGPPGTYVEGNNEIALALLMILPLMQFLRMTSQDKWVRGALLASMALCAFSIVGSQSRGAFLAGFTMAAFLWLKSRGKVLTGAVLVIAIPFLISFMPEHWHERMRTIETYQSDESAMGRLKTWEMTVRLANDRPTGGGFELWSADVFDRYSPDKKSPNDAHSIYFKVLAEHGWVGLILFLGIGFAAWRTGTWIIVRSKGREDLQWLSNLARMCQVSLAAFASGGAFLSLSYFDLYWHLLAILVIGKALLQQQLAGTARPVKGRASGSPLVAGRRGTAPVQMDRDRKSTT
jgi:putative inorganic carbon (HCO3(-)) transporter